MAGLPGMMRISEKTPREMRNSRSTVMSNRRATKVGSEPPLEAIAAD
jgi:hypothetical protein